MSELMSGWLLPAIYTLGALLALAQHTQPWRVARGTAWLGMWATLATVAGALLLSRWQPLAIDTLGLAAAALIAVLGWVITQYCWRYLQGEPNQPLFVRALLITLACVSVLVVSRNLLIMALAWCGSSISLHYLLTFYRERKAAQLVAHKKFIASRLADACLLIALVLVYHSVGTFSLSAISSHISTLDALPVALHLATALIALAAILKSAQLPLHGWLIQVMEAPTPVSALLHAGVVNMGGFVLIRLADWVAMAPAAQAMLVIVGSLTAVLAGLVMMTRISIKVRLAWSTCSQMGFMLMEIGLGLYELALLHLLAHSLYKAYAFLSAGETVATAKATDFFAQVRPARSPGWYITALVLSGMLVAGSAIGWQWALPELNLPIAAVIIVALGLAPLLWLEQGRSASLLLNGGIRVLLLTQLYMVWHLLFAGLAPAAAEVSTALMVWAASSFIVLYAMQVWLRSYPEGRLSRTLYPWAYCGFYLDETFTRLAFKFWPAKLSPTQAKLTPHQQSRYAGDMA